LIYIYIYLCITNIIYLFIKNGPVPTTLGDVVPLGTERLRVCELFAEVIHLQYLYSSSPLFDRIVFEQKEGEHKRTLVEELITITDKFTERKMLPICLVYIYIY